MARRVKCESLQNLKTVVNASSEKTVDAVGDMGVVMANAVAESARNDEYVEKVMDELKKESEGLTPEEGSTGAPVKDELNKKIKLSEDLEDFVDDAEDEKKTRITDESKAERYVDFDMFDFIYEFLATYNDPLRTPVNFLGSEYHRFGGFGRDRYKGLDAATASKIKRMEACDALGIEYTETYDKEIERKITDMIKYLASMDDSGNKGPAIASGGDYIELYGQDPEEFKGAIELCKRYDLEYKGPDKTYKEKRPWLMKKKDEWLSYRYTMKIYVPCGTDGFPMNAVEYLESKNIALEDAMPPAYVTGYRKAVARAEREQQQALAKKAREDAKAAKEAEKAAMESRVKEIVDEFIVYAAQHGDESFEGIKRNMISKLRSEGLTFKITDVTNQLFDAFNDDELDEAE